MKYLICGILGIAISKCAVLPETTEFQTGQKKTLHTFVHFFVKCLELVQVALILMCYAIMT